MIRLTLGLGPRSCAWPFGGSLRARRGGSRGSEEEPGGGGQRRPPQGRASAVGSPRAGYAGAETVGVRAIKVESDHSIAIIAANVERSRRCERNCPTPVPKRA